MIIPSNLNANTNNPENNSEYDVTTKINLNVLDNMQIKKELYYKMNFIMKYLEKNWSIKKRNSVFFFKNVENGDKEIITEDYLNRHIIDKIYKNAATLSRQQDANVIPSSHLENSKQGEAREAREVREIKKKDIIPLRDGIKALKYMIENQKIDINTEIRNKIYVMHFVMNTLENGWTIRKKNDNFVFRKKHKNRNEIYSDDYLVNFLKVNLANNI